MREEFLEIPILKLLMFLESKSLEDFAGSLGLYPAKFDR